MMRSFLFATLLVVHLCRIAGSQVTSPEPALHASHLHPPITGIHVPAALADSGVQVTPFSTGLKDMRDGSGFINVTIPIDKQKLVDRWISESAQRRSKFYGPTSEMTMLGGLGGYLSTKINVSGGHFGPTYSLTDAAKDLLQITQIHTVSCRLAVNSTEDFCALVPLFRQARCLELTGCFITGKELNMIADAPYIECLDLSDTLVKSDDLRLLEGLVNLKSLSLGGCDVDDQSVARLIEHCPQLRILFVHGTKVGPHAVAATKGSRLQVLDFSFSALDDAAIRETLKNSFLLELYVNGTPITAHAFDGIDLPPKLKILSLDETKISEQDRSVLQTRFPKVMLSVLKK